MDGEGFKFGISLMNVDPPELFIEHAKLVDELGYQFLWMADSSLHGRLVYAYMTLAAVNTRHVQLGTNCTHPLSYHPGMTANSITTINEISGGRAVLGVGAGGGPTAEFGFSKPASVKRVTSLIEVARALLAGETLDYKSADFELKGGRIYFVPEGLPTPKIYMTATGPRMLALAGEIADGVLIHCGAAPECLDFALARVREGAEKAGRNLEDIDLAWHLWGCFEEDLAIAREVARPGAALMAKLAPQYCAIAGIPQSVVDDINNAYTGNHFPEAKEAHAKATDEMVDKLIVAGGAEQWMDRVEMARQAGLNHIEIFPLGDRSRLIESFARKVAAQLN